MKHMMKTIVDEFLAFAIALALIFVFAGIAVCMQIPVSDFALGLVCWLWAREFMKSARKNG